MSVTQPRRLLQTFVVLVFIPTAVACGGGSSHSSSAKSLTKEQWAARANAACATAKARLGGLPEPKAPADYVKAAEAIVNTFTGIQRELRAIPAPPASIAADISTYLADNDAQLRVLRAGLPAIRAAASTGNVARVKAAFDPAVSAYAKIAAEQAAVGQRLGLTVCDQN